MIGELIGGIAQYGASKKAARAQAEALAEQRARLDGISIPEAKRLVVEELVSQGKLTPELQEAFELPDSEVAKIQEDASLRQNQVQALELIKQRAQGGLTAADRADYNTMRNQVARDNQARQAALLQQMQARGLGGSGAELAASLANSQQSAQMASEEGDRMAAAASRQAMEAAIQQAAMAGSLRQQDLGVAQMKASAQDEYNRFNVANKQNIANANIQMRNQANAANLAEKQRLHEGNIANRRDEDVRYQGALQQQFQNQWMKATGLNGITAQQGQNEANKHLARGQFIGSMGKLVDDTAYKVAGAMMGNPMALAGGGGGGGSSGGFGGAPAYDGTNLSAAMAPPPAPAKSSPWGLGVGFAEGGEVPGEALVDGDHPVNDIVPASLSPGEIVLPRSVTQSENPAKEAAKFVKDIESQQASSAAQFLAKYLSKKGGK